MVAQVNRLDTFPAKDLLQKYRNVFSSPEGPAVLTHMLFELGLFEDIPNMGAEDSALKNYGSRLLKILGGDEVKSESIEVFVKRLMGQPLKEEGKDE